MKETAKRKFRKIYNILFAVCTVAIGLTLISQAWGIFRSAPEKAFSRASVGERLLAISPALIAWLVALIGSILVNFLMPKPPVLPIKSNASTSHTLQSFAKRFKKRGEVVQGVAMLRFLRLALRLTGGVFIFVLTVFGGVYLFDKGYVAKHSAPIFSSHNAAADRIISALPYFALALMLGFLISIACEYLRVKEISLLKAAFVEEVKKQKLGKKSLILYEKGVDKEHVTLFEKWEKFVQDKAKGFEIGRLSVRIFLFVSAIVLIILGIHWGGMDLVFEKARSICQQCIGLG